MIDTTILAGFLHSNNSLTKLDLSTNRIINREWMEKDQKYIGKMDLRGLKTLLTALEGLPLASLSLSSALYPVFHVISHRLGVTELA